MPPATSTALSSAPIWKSPFRPLYLLGALYCPVLMILWLGGYFGFSLGPNAVYSANLWHGHEMVFGFFGAIVAGFTLTFLGSWAQTEEISGWRLMLLALLWVLGRLAFYFSSQLPELLVLAVDSSLYLVISIMVTPRLWAAPNRVYLAALIIFMGICLGNILFHWGIIQQNPELTALGLRTAIYAIMIKFVVAGAFLAVVFTNNILPERGIEEIRFNPTIEFLSILSVAFFILSDLLTMSSDWRLTASLSALLIHSLRFARWHTWQIRKYPIILIMHMAYLWLLATFALRALYDYNQIISNHLWLHAFTAGALGLMGISFMTRVVLRHTGRTLQPSPLLVVCYGLIFIAAILRIWAYLFQFNLQLMLFSAVLWTIPFTVYLFLYSHMLWQPSLEKRKLPKNG